MNKSFLEKRIYDLEQLITFARSLASSLELSFVLDVLLTRCIGQFYSSGAAIFLPQNENPLCYTLFHSIGFDDAEQIKRTQIDFNTAENQLQEIFKNPHSYHISTLDKRSGLYKFFIKTFDNINASIVTPIRNKGRLIGVLVLGDKLIGEDYNNEDLDSLDSLGSFVGLALENAKLFEEATTDKLTKLYNRHFLFVKLKEHFENYKRDRKAISLAILDIDFFKKINDVHGHIQGDIILQELSHIIYTQTKKEFRSAFCSRFGGEEFILVLPNASIDEAYSYCDQLREEISQHTFSKEVNEMTLTISIGVTEYNEERILNKIFEQDKNYVQAKNGVLHEIHVQEEKVKFFIQEADKALYKSKRDGRNRCTSYAHSIEDLFKNVPTEEIDGILKKQPKTIS